MQYDEINALAARLLGQPPISFHVSVELLNELLHTIFLVSLKTEERSHLTCTVTFGSPEEFDKQPRRYYDQPTCIQFNRPIPFTTHNLAKLALATDPACSSIGIMNE